jgi:hypothetical protein
VPVTVVSLLAVADGVCANGGATTELVVADADTRVDHIGSNTGTAIRVRVRAAEGKVVLIDPIDAPGRSALDRLNARAPVALDRNDTLIGHEGAKPPLRDRPRIALQRVLVDEADIDSVAMRMLRGDGGCVR